MKINQKIRSILLSDIIIENYQRDLNNARVNRIAKNFDPNKIGVLVVSHRDDGTYAIIDGQHRLCAMRKCGISEVNCVVNEDMTYEQEADYYRKQTENTQFLDAYAMFRAGIAAGDQHYLKIQDILDRNGYKIGLKTEPMTITAVNALSRIVSIFGADILDRMLLYIKNVWHGDSTALRREMLAGMAEFIMRFDGKSSPELFAKRMCGKLPSDLFYEYRCRSDGRINAHSAFKPMFRRLFCVILCDQYNKGMGSNSKLRLKIED